MFYYLLLVGILPLSLLPFRLLYLLSDILYILIYHIAGYRKKIVRENLKNAFPEKKPDELASIEREFYHHFCDLIVENVKFLTISAETIKKRCTFSNPEVADSWYDKSPFLFALTGHIGNWEMAGISVSHHVRFWPVVSYKPFSNVIFEKIMKKLRSRHFDLLPYYEVYNTLLNHHSSTQKAILHHGRKPVYIFVIDQSPSQKNATCWTTFLNQETAFYTKTEELARTLNAPVLFCEIQRIARGYFNVYLTLITDQAAHMPPHAITLTYARMLEQVIKKHPANWLWTHRRWKRKRKM